MPEVLLPIARVLIPIGLGLFLRAIRLFGDEEGAVLRRFVVRFTVPVFVFFALYEARPESIASIGPMMGALVLMTLALFMLGWATASFFPASQRTAVHACIVFGNYGWMGLGVAQALLGAEGSQRVVYFILLWWPVFYTFGLLIGFVHLGARTESSPKRGMPLRRTFAVAAPPIVAMALGLAMNLAGTPLPAVAVDVLKPLGDMTVPLILLSVGMLLDFRRLTREVKPALCISAATLLLAPAIGWRLAAFLAKDPISFKVMVLESAMPVATLVPLLQENYEMDKDLVSTAIVLSTALSLITLPAVAAIIMG